MINIEQDNLDSRTLVEAYSNLGDLLQEYGYFGDAIINYQKAIELAQKLADAFDIKLKFRKSISIEQAVVNYQEILQKFITLDTYKHFENILQNNKTQIDEALINYKENNKTLILISVPVFNRGKITKLSLEQTRRYKTPNCYLQVYNDHSTEFDNSLLEPYADEVILLPRKMGIHNLRWHQFKKFLETDFDFIYMTDNDIIHDPQYIAVLEILYQVGGRKLPVCIYNSKDHMGENIILYNQNGIMLKKTAPGFSMFYDREMVEKIMSVFNKVNYDHDNYGWDYRAMAYLGLPWITSETSYLEHYGSGGIHNTDFETDRAINPTRYLEEKREAILDYLTKDKPLQMQF